MRILYLTALAVDVDSASLQRMLGIGAAWGAQGYEVLVAGQGGFARHASPFENVCLEGVTDSTSSGRLSRMLSANGLSSWLDGYTEPVDLVVVYGGTGRLTSVVKDWARRRGIPRVIDSVEWYEPSSFRGGRFGPRAIDNELSVRRRFPAYDGAIAISRFLDWHYRQSGTRQVVRVPPLMDTHGLHPLTLGERSAGPIRMLYAGNPGRKDSLGRVVQALAEVDARGDHLRLQVLGVTPDDARLLPEMPATLPSSAEFFGRVTRDEVLAALRIAHFVPIIRRDARYACAGFSTKLVEAMTAGVAVLGNSTSDMSEHIEDGVDGVLVPNASVEAVRQSLERVLTLGPAAAEAMGLAAREHALQAFDYRQYSEALDRFAVAVRQESA